MGSTTNKNSFNSFFVLVGIGWRPFLANFIMIWWLLQDKEITKTLKSSICKWSYIKTTNSKLPFSYAWLSTHSNKNRTVLNQGKWTKQRRVRKWCLILICFVVSRIVNEYWIAQTYVKTDMSLHISWGPVLTYLCIRTISSWPFWSGKLMFEHGLTS